MRAAYDYSLESGAMPPIIADFLILLDDNLILSTHQNPTKWTHFGFPWYMVLQRDPLK